MLADDPPRKLIEQTCKVLSKPLHDLGVTREIPPELTAHLEKDIYLFSGCKTYHEIEEASRMLKDENGGFKLFDTFAHDIEKINNKYNSYYLNAEYNFAIASTQMAVKWKDYEQDGDRYYLQYRTAADEKVREEHTALHNVTLPPSDRFWDSYYPPNGWNCRCTVVQVRKDKYPKSNSADAMAAGQHATTHIGKDGSNKAAIFRFNPGKQEKIFPPKHPYYKVPDEVKKTVKKTAKKNKATKLRNRYLHEMQPLLDKKVTVNGNGHTMTVGFTKYGNKHLYADTFKKSQYLQKDDLKDVGKLLAKSKFIRKSKLYKKRNDNIKRFYYYETTLHGKTVYLQVAETDKFINGKGLYHERFLYTITDKLL